MGGSRSTIVALSPCTITTFVALLGLVMVPIGRTLLALCKMPSKVFQLIATALTVAGVALPGMATWIDPMGGNAQVAVAEIAVVGGCASNGVVT